VSDPHTAAVAAFLPLARRYEEIVDSKKLEGLPRCGSSGRLWQVSTYSDPASPTMLRFITRYVSSNCSPKIAGARYAMA
jgi:hypothetical protein